jgi:hypothetical protein
MPASLTSAINHTALPGKIRSPVGPVQPCTPYAPARRNPMLDIAFLVVGALFLGACVLYALACDKL